MIEFFAFLLAVGIVMFLVTMLILFALGMMHVHLSSKGEGFGRDEDLHNKVDKLLYSKDDTDAR